MNTTVAASRRHRGSVGTWAVTLGALGREIYNLDSRRAAHVNAILIALERRLGTDMGWTASYRNLRRR